MVRTMMAQPQQEAAQVLLAKRMFIVGCLGLPWLWAVNVWYFWGKVYNGRNRRRHPELVTWVSRSLVGAIVGFALFIMWVVIFQLRWKSWGSTVLPFMINTPEQYSTGW